MCHVQKLHRIGQSVFGWSGDAVIALAFVEWLSSARNKPTLYKLIPEAYRDDISVLELSPQGLAYWNGWGVRMPLLDATYAIGSGAMAALQALRLNASPQEAVLHAMQLDECSGALSEPAVEPLYVPKPKRKRRG
jgi:hypothetical protein